MKKVLILRSDDMQLTHSIYRAAADSEKLIDLLYKDGFSQVKQYFDKYFNMLVDKITKKELVELITIFRESLEAQFYDHVYTNMWGFKGYIEEADDKELIVNNLIKLVVVPLFFYSDLSIAVLTGNITNLKKIQRKLIIAQNKIDKLKPSAKRGEEMTGRNKLKPKEKKLLQEILSIQKELFKKHGGGHKSSLTRAIIKYSRDNHLSWHYEGNENIIHSEHSKILYHLEQGNLQK